MWLFVTSLKWSSTLLIELTTTPPPPTLVWGGSDGLSGPAARQIFQFYGTIRRRSHDGQHQDGVRLVSTLPQQMTMKKQKSEM